MSLAISKLVSSIIQIILFSLIPFIWWLITARKECGFLKWIGLKKPEGEKHKTLFWIAGVSVAFLILSVVILYLLKGVETATSDFSGHGAAAIPAILIYAILNTALSEEILFRGFLLKRISNKIGVTVGNIIQATLFGLLHGVMFYSAVGIVKALIVIVFTGGIGWCMGYTNEKIAGGSILPSWCIHALANIFSGICSAFLLF
ncbi:CPBP family intramembrane glutamic endopeptidase [Butyrivibrio sp. INlla21]|uniref:CPBP family intramembrane glutamic endopeptidase n=1 Tax=Butyrivibrio sp. INlla21 TaxID=1520811 RepID=UPI0008EE09B7|nr:CPBP family intramembrane glutamic endopeptidase [Butyrivibrio sp. INlla21]SFV02013.1 CAAX protease self-immunity [Butyrivibrio sp. INlla21]